MYKLRRRYTTEQKFCRSCGLNLEQTARSLLDQVPSAESAGLLRKQRALEKFGNVAFTGFVAAVTIAVIGLIYTVFVKMVLTGASPLVGIVFMALMIFAGLGLAYVVMRESMKEGKSKLKPDILRELQKVRVSENYSKREISNPR